MNKMAIKERLTLLIVLHITYACHTSPSFKNQLRWGMSTKKLKNKFQEKQEAATSTKTQPHITSNNKPDVYVSEESITSPTEEKN